MLCFSNINSLKSKRYTNLTLVLWGLLVAGNPTETNSALKNAKMKLICTVAGPYFLGILLLEGVHFVDNTTSKVQAAFEQPVAFCTIFGTRFL